MRKLAHSIVLLMLLLATSIGHARGQTLLNHDTLYVCNQMGLSSQFQHQYSSSNEEFDAWVIIDVGEANTSFTFNSYSTRGSVEGPMLGYISVWDDDSITGTPLVNHFSGSSSFQTLTSPTGRLYVHIHYDAYSTDTIYRTTRTLVIRWDNSSFNSSPCQNNTLTLTSTATTTNSAILQWHPHYDSVIVRIDGRSFLVEDDSVNITGLTPNTRYLFTITPTTLTDSPCCAYRGEIYTDPLAHIGCPDVLNLRSDYVRCSYGTFGNPFLYTGIVDEGSGMTTSRHTLNTDTTQTDAASGGLLHTVGSGLPGSIRLGNWRTGSEAEAITYFLHIDTNIYSLFVLHYAAVLQNPNHSESQQPRFVMQVLNGQNEVIDADCGAANFTASEDQNWQTGYSALWKDWTTVGINLAPYHGQDVKLRFITYDCSEGAHFGYAYFYAECKQPFASADQCGNVDTVTLTAPDGFRYIWYTDNINNPIDTTQSIVAGSSLGDIHCRLVFIANPTCYITMNTHIDNFWPSARVDTLYTINHGCDGYEVHFHNNSTIVDDFGTQLPGNPTCDNAYWDFGDGRSSTQYQPVHTFRHSNTYTVTLIASLGGGLCRDTTTYTIVAPDAWATADQYIDCCDSILWLDSLWYSRDTVGPTARIHFPLSCDTVYTLHLSTLPSAHTTLPSDTICYAPNYPWRSQMVPSDYTLTDTAYHILTDTLVAANQCDSLVHQPFVQLPPDNLSIDIQPDCIVGTYILSANTDKPLWQWASSPIDSLISGHENDTSLAVAPDSSYTYFLTSYYNDTLFCPTTVSRILSPPGMNHLELEVNPDVITFEHQILKAYDKSDDLGFRRWNIVNHPASDTILLPDTLRHIAYPVNLDNDSVTVILSVGQQVCLDTLKRTIPIILTNIFVPNVFTPGADINNRFSIFCEGLLEGELTLYNRNGLLVFSTTDLDQGWDGTHNGTSCPQGAYVWHLRVKTADRPDDWRTLVGTVTLLR